MTYELFDVVTSLVAIPADGIHIGQVGAIVDILHNPDAYYVEFCNAQGETLALSPLYSNQITHADLRQAA